MPIIRASSRSSFAAQLDARPAASRALRLDAPLPVQIDGEALGADFYHISIAPRALRVVVPCQGESARS